MLPAARINQFFRTHLLPVAVMLISVASTLAVAAYVQSSWDAKERSRFDQAVSQSREEVNGRVQTYMALARGALGLFASDSDANVTPIDFERFATPLDIANRYPGVQALGFGLVVPDRETEAFEARQAAAGLPGFKIFPRTRKDFHVPVTYSVPTPDVRAFGFDMASEPVRLAAMSTAMDSGKAAATTRLLLKGEPSHDSGFLLYLPIYKRGMPTSTLTERRSAILGFIYLPFTGDHFVRSLSSPYDSTVNFDLYDGMAYPATLLNTADVSPARFHYRFTSTVNVQIANRTFTLVYHDTPALAQQSDLPLAKVILLAGLGISVLLFVLTSSTVRSREAALTEVAVRKAAEETLANREEQMRTLLEALPVGVWLLNDKGRVLFGNPAGSRIWEGTPGTKGQIKDESMGRWSHEGDAIIAGDSASRRALDSGVTTINDLMVIEMEDGRRKTLLTSAVPLRKQQGSIVGAVVVNEDISMRRHAEAALMESEERFRVMADSAPVMLWVSGGDKQSTWFNQPWLDYVGRSMQSELGHGWAQNIHPSEAQKCVETYHSSFEKREPFEMEFRLRRHDGLYRWFLYRGVPRFDPDGAFLGYISSCLDIEDRKQAEETMKSINATLERWVNERTSDLKRTIDELESFSYTVAHDLRAPLRAMGGYAQMLQEDFRGLLTPEGMSYLGRIKENSLKMGELIDGLLDLARLSRADLNKDAVDVTAAANEIVSMLKSRSQQRDVDVEVEEGLQAVGDERLLVLVLQNLLDNAWKFTEPCEKAKITVGALPDTDGTQGFFVRDNGVGFDMAHASKLFGTFERLHKPGEFTGSGIGLASAKRIVDRHGGRIWAESKPGQGATFYFRLPRLTPSKNQARLA